MYGKSRLNSSNLAGYPSTLTRQNSFFPGRVNYFSVIEVIIIFFPKCFPTCNCRQENNNSSPYDLLSYVFAINFLF